MLLRTIIKDANGKEYLLFSDLTGRQEAKEDKQECLYTGLYSHAISKIAEIKAEQAEPEYRKNENK